MTSAKPVRLGAQEALSITGPILPAPRLGCNNPTTECPRARRTHAGHEFRAGDAVVQQCRYPAKATSVVLARTRRSSHTRTAPVVAKRNPCATGALETLTHQGFHAIVSHSPDCEIPVSIRLSASRQPPRLALSTYARAADRRPEDRSTRSHVKVPRPASSGWRPKCPWTAVGS